MVGVRGFGFRVPFEDRLHRLIRDENLTWLTVQPEDHRPRAVFPHIARREELHDQRLPTLDLNRHFFARRKAIEKIRGRNGGCIAVRQPVLLVVDEDLRIRRELDRFFRASGVEVRLVMHFDNIQTIKEAVALGSGISILPARTMQAEIAQGRLVAVKLNAPELVRPVGIVHRKRKKFNRAAQSFLELLVR